MATQASGEHRHPAPGAAISAQGADGRTPFTGSRGLPRPTTQTTITPSPRAAERPFAAGARARIAAVLPREPLLRNGHLLVMSSLVNAGLGAVFWVLATRWYDDSTVGINYATVSAATLLSTIGQLNLSDFLVRFVPSAGRHTRTLILACYLASVVCSVLVSIGFLFLVPTISPRLDFLLSPLTAFFFVTYTAAYAIFALQDGALTGVRHPGWVATENAIFAVVKIVLLAATALLTLFAGILISWAGALVVAILVANAFLLRRAVPRHERAAPEATRPPPRMLGYATADYLGSLFRMAAYTLVPLLVLNTLGPAQSAYYSLAWIVGYIPYLLATNMGSSLIVEAAHDPDRLAEHAFRVLRHSAMLMSAGAAVMIVIAPRLLAFFGPEYEEHGTTLLRLMALSALPNLLVSMAVDVARMRRRLRLVVGLQLALCVLVLGLSLILLPTLGLAGGGLAWLVALSLIALYLVVRRSQWLPRRPADSSSTSAPEGSRPSGFAPLSDKEK
ncbi:lipopolysaccharide biosynthesis protein [Streptomyces sp. NBC_01092]|uniref:lipopolysaccharide biosynthesis protein n=1 Tax=Streptomyces sp. NBC_01092 TaxID=2903748 RepID=UPI00386953FD|nr:lipopolysaccharide biosynthesis protein [Streptomyces sp. NBC_01092]